MGQRCCTDTELHNGVALYFIGASQRRVTRFRQSSGSLRDLAREPRRFPCLLEAVDAHDFEACSEP